MQAIATELEGVLIIEPRVFADNRGFFYESYNLRDFAAAGIDVAFVQDNHSRSTRGTVRGLHYIAPPGQAKLVRVVCGEVWDVVVDVRWGSPTYGKWVGVTLSAENHRQLYVPPGLAHGFCVTSEAADFVYKVTSYYVPAEERGIAWDDPDLAIPWPTDEPVLSARDLCRPRLKDAPREYMYR